MAVNSLRQWDMPLSIDLNTLFFSSRNILMSWLLAELKETL